MLVNYDNACMCYVDVYLKTKKKQKSYNYSRGIARFPCDSTAVFLRKGAAQSRPTNNVVWLRPYVNFGEVIIIKLIEVNSCTSIVNAN